MLTHFVEADLGILEFILLEIVDIKRMVGCKCGSRYVEGCWGFPYLKKFLGFLVFGLLVSWFMVFWFLGFKTS